MRHNLTRILNIRLYQAFDLDADDRVLAGSDDTGSTQLIEMAADGTRTPLTAGKATWPRWPRARTVPLPQHLQTPQQGSPQVRTRLRGRRTGASGGRRLGTWSERIQTGWLHA
jgi:hypothetical protein